MTEFKKGIREAEETKDEVINDVRKIGNEVDEETKKATGLDDSEDSMS